MTNYIDIIQSVVPTFEKDQLTDSFADAGIDSIDLVTIRVEFERLRETPIPDRDWMTFNTFQEVINYCEKGDSTDSDQQGNSADLNLNKKMVINMPEMAIENLSENWLFKELGKEHWDLLCKGLDTPSSQMADELGNRLYATFVRIQLLSDQSLRDFNENEEVQMTGSIKRYGGGMYFSKFEFQSLDETNKSIKANLMTSFSIRKSTGNKELVKSQPNSPTNLIESHDQIPAFGNDYRRIKKQELKEISVNGEVFQVSDDDLFTYEYQLNPYYDLNGVGLLYFASYPIINDFCESNYFNSQEGRSTRWESSHATSARDILYYANCDMDDSIIYRLNSVEDLGNKVKISSSLYRKSDQKMMARIFTVKSKVQ
ncbi:MAG: hypothetical protein HRT74_02255 [Flavobacteriales bacterium]|nr:hypothetical protein [Flavobacteriales bacterium]